MTSASSLAFPGSRTLATWWRQLASFKPRVLGVGYLFLHRLEAPAYWLDTEPLDPFLRLVLEALVLEQRRCASGLDSRVLRLHERLNLAVPVIQRLLRHLTELQLLKAHVPVADQGPSWEITEAGHEALRTGKISSGRRRRGLFSFVERLDPNGERRAPPHYARIADGPATPWVVPSGAEFAVSWLHDCLERGHEWKTTFGFPTEVTGFISAALEGAAARPDDLVVDRSERLLVVLAQSCRQREEFLVFGVDPEGWVLHAEPIVQLPAAAGAVFWEQSQSPELAPWERAWLSWCQHWHVPPAYGRDCNFSLVEERVRVGAPERLVRLLQSGKSDVFKGETWLLAGDAYLRQAARLDVVSVTK
jgi:hypothetical protein